MSNIPLVYTYSSDESYGVSKLVDVTVSDPESRFPLNLTVTASLYIIEITYN